MTPLESLHRRGYLVTLLSDERLHIVPSLNGLKEKVARHKAAIVDELRQHQARMIAQAEELELRILAALELDRITSQDAEDKLSYIFQLTATTPAPFPPCDCSEVLLWCHPEEMAAVAAPEKRLPLLCYRCHPPKDGCARFFLADESAPATARRAADDLEHTEGWM